jgi:hypothetical protein
MSLPKISVPIYNLILPSNSKEIKYRPFLVKEEKILLWAVESQDVKQISNAVKQIITNCVVTKGIKVEQLPSFDIEYLFLNIRGKSVGEELDLKIYCPDDGETEVHVKININDINVIKNPEHTNKIELDSDMILEFKYPSLDQFIKNNFNPETINIDESFDLIIDCIDRLHDGNTKKVHEHNDYTKDKWLEFLEQLTTASFSKVQTFFETMPKLSHRIEVENPKTKVKSEVVLEGLGDFFTS